MNKEAITIVFSTRDNNPEFINHLKQTCGIEDVEILQYINNGEYSLTQIYNKGLKEGKNPVIVFCHDDIIFEQSSNWGEKIVKHFQESDFGIIGKAGTTSLTESGRWWDQPHLMIGQVWHQQAKLGRTVTWENEYSGNFGERIVETIIVDGLFFAVHRERIKRHFDENIKGFQFYDIDFTFGNHIEGVKVGVIFNMKITHKSIGMTNQKWELNRIQFVDKWKKHLPHSITPGIIVEQLNITLERQPRLAILILTKDRLDVLSGCIDSIREKTSYQNYKLYIADTGSKRNNLEKIRDYVTTREDTVFLEYSYHNFARIHNDIVKNHIDPDTELLLFCHDDIKLLNDALSRCVQTYLHNKNEIGTIGIRLHFADNSIQHAGLFMFVDRNNYLRLIHKGLRSYYSYNPGIERDIFANSNAFLLVNKDLFISLGGFPEHYAGYFEDVEFNIKSVIAGRINYFIGDAVAYHFESQNVYDNPEKSAKQREDFQRLFLFIQQNTNSSRLINHIRHIT